VPAPQTGAINKEDDMATTKKTAEDPANLFAEIESLHDRLALVIKTVNAVNIRCQTETGRNQSNDDGFSGQG